MSLTNADESNFKEYQESTTITLEWTVRGLRQLFDASKGEQKSKVAKSVKFGGGRWQILLYPNSGHEGGYVSLYLSCEPTQEEKSNGINGKWSREGQFKFSFDLKTVNKTAAILFNTKEACDHEFSYKTMNWGWAQFAKRDAVFYSAPAVRTADAFLIVCTITSSPVTPAPPPATARQYVPKGLMDAIGGMLDDPTYSDVEFILPSRTRGRRGGVRRIYANKKILQRAEYFDDMFKSGFAEANIRQDDLASPGPADMEEEARSLEDSDESDDDTETDVNASMDFVFVNDASNRTSRDATWETQSDTAAVTGPHPPTRDDEEMSEAAQQPPQQESPSRAGTDVGVGDKDASPPGNEDADLDVEANRRNVRQKLAHSALSDSATTTSAAERSRSQLRTQIQPPVPGPSKTTVVVRDVAYATYFAFLYYLYTDCIVFAPLSSSFINNVPVPVRSTQGTPALNSFGSSMQSYFPAAGAMNPPPARPRSSMAPGLGGATMGSNEDEPPRTRKEWVKQWLASNPSRPPPVSAKAIYKLADKLGLGDLKQRAFKHIIRSLTVANIPYETFSSFSASYDEIRKVEMEFLLENWTQIRTSDAMRNVFGQIRLGRHPGFEEIWPLIVQHLVVKPDGDVGIAGRGVGAKEGPAVEGQRGNDHEM